MGVVSPFCRCADKGLLASAGLSLRVARRKTPGCRRDDLIVEDAPLADLQPMAKRSSRGLDQPLAPGVVRHGCMEAEGIAGTDRENPSLVKGTSRATSIIRAMTRFRTSLPALAATFTMSRMPINELTRECAGLGDKTAGDPPQKDDTPEQGDEPGEDGSPKA